jgi:hypothetical protein
VKTTEKFLAPELIPIIPVTATNMNGAKAKIVAKGCRFLLRMMRLIKLFLRRSRFLYAGFI